MKKSKSEKDYAHLHELSLNVRTLQGVIALLDWDQETYMPPAASESRAQQLKVLASIAHKEKTSKHFEKALSKLIDLESGEIKAKGLTKAQEAALKWWRRDYRKAIALPNRFVQEFAKLCSQSQQVWRKARDENAFGQFEPYLEKIIDMCRQKAGYLGYKEHPYDALLDEYELEATTKEVAELFKTLGLSISSLLKSITAKKQIDDSFLHGDFSKDKQMKFGYQILSDMGYEMDKGRVDLSAHPFSSSAHPHDSRITTRFDNSSIVSNVKILLHEGGHSLYEMGLPPSEFGTPLGDALSLGMHESQSRWWETRIGQSKPFWEFYLPLLKKVFPEINQNVSLEEFYRAVNKVEPSFIRVEADEVTYPLHVILRFELEKQLIEGSLKVKEIPEAWNAKMKSLLGITPPEDRVGCLQDVHWSMGGFGYFPTYTLGNIYAAHLFEFFERENRNWSQKVAKGDLRFIKEWLNDKVHKFGRRYTSKELLKHITGKELTAEPYLTYLKGKYKEIYA